MNISTDTKNKQQLSHEDAQLDSILQRLEDCQNLVEAELDEYRHAPGTDGPMRTNYKLSVVIPVYNEENTILRVISRVAALPINTEIIVVDDFSTDNTRSLLSKLEGTPNLKIVLKDLFILI